MARIIRFFLKYIYALISCLYLFAVGFLIDKNRPLISNICKHFGLPKKTDIIPKVELSEILPDDYMVHMFELAHTSGNVTIFELFVIALLVKSYASKKIFEIGTFDGRTTLNIAANCSDQASVYTLDLPKEGADSAKLPILPNEKAFINKNSSGSRFAETDYEKKITQLYGDSAVFDFSPFCNTIDFIFIDGSHSYEYVLQDSRVALDLLKNRQGLILWHDYAWWEDVTKGLNKLYAKGGDFKGLKHIKGTSLAYLHLQPK